MLPDGGTGVVVGGGVLHRKCSVCVQYVCMGFWLVSMEYNNVYVVYRRVNRGFCRYE